MLLQICANGKHIKPFFLFQKNCLSTDCQSLGLNILLSLNYSVSPCKDFYKFTCSNYNSKTLKPPSEPYWNVWQESRHEIYKRLEHLFKENEKSDEAIKKSIDFYNTCLNLEVNGRKQIVEMKVLLQKLGGWMHKALTNQEAIRWEFLLADVINNVGIDPIFKVHVEVDFDDTTKYLLYLEPGELTLPLQLYLENYNNTKEHYHDWMLKTLHIVLDDQITDKDVNEVMHFETKLAKLMRSEKNNLKKFTIAELKNDCFRDFEIVMKNIFQGVDYNITESTVIAIKNYGYFKKALRLLENTKNYKIWNYIIWILVKNLSGEVNMELRSLNFKINQAIFDVEEDISLKQECAQKTMDYLKYAHLPEYIKKYSEKGMFTAVSEIILGVKYEFVKLINNSKWMSDETKMKSIEKIKGIKTYIGYPKWIHNNTLLHQYYRHINFKHNHLLNVLKLKTFSKTANLQQLGRTVDLLDWSVNPLEVNAYYSILRNSILLPLGILMDPFFNLYRPKLFNFGSLGSLIGHEISHALDTRAIRANERGELKAWWPEKDWNNYSERIKCFNDQYLQSHTEFALSENIADNIGLILSYNALFHNNYKPVAIPFIESLTHEQLFFVSYGQMWCESSGKSLDFLHEEHGENKDRVLGTEQIV